MLGVFAQISTDKEIVESLMQPVETCDRLLGEIQKLQQLVDDLEYKLDFRGIGVKSMEEIHREFQTAQNTKYESIISNLFSALIYIIFLINFLVVTT